MNPESDISLLHQFVRTKDPVAFDELARRYRGMVFSIARRVTQSPHDADDVAQNVFLELARKAASIRTSISAFLHSTATRRSIDLLRDHGRRRKHEQEAAATRPQPDTTLDPERSWDEISPEVDQAIDRLPDDLKTFVILYFLRGLSIADIGLETGLNRGMIERRLQVAIRRLRSDLSKGNRVVLAGVLAVGLKASSAKAVPASLTAATGRMALAAGLNANSLPPVKQTHPLRFWLPRWLGPAFAVSGMLSLFAFLPHLWKTGPSQGTTPYDELNRVYAPYLPVGEASSFAFHAAQMRTDTSSFWKGSQPLFFEWCKFNCPDWFADSADYTRCNASPNLEDVQHLATLANTDSSASLPVQIELLQGMVLVRLAADRNLGPASDITTAEVASALCKSYRDSLLSDEPISHIESDTPNSDESAEYVDQLGNLKSIVLDRRGKPLAFLRPSPIDVPHLNEMLADAISRCPVLRGLCGDHPAVQSVRACIRHDAVVTQGQLLLVAQLRYSGILLEIKQQTPAPAELALAVPRDRRSPAQRAAEDAAALSPTGVAPVGWADWGGNSFTFMPLDLHRQVYELRKDRWTDPIQAAQSWGTATARTHRRDPNRNRLASAITPELQTLLVDRSDAYLKALQADLQSFRADQRVAVNRATEDSLSASWLDQVRHSK